MKKLLKYLIVPVILAPAIYLALSWNQIPPRVAMHFDLRGNADRFGNRSELLNMVTLLTVLNIVIYLVLTNIYRIDPKKYAADNKTRLQRIGMAVVVFMAAITVMITHSAVTGRMKFEANLVLAAVGLLFAFIGNYMPNLKPNYFAGLRLPWTLENADNWKKTHFLAGKLWFAGGLVLAVGCLFLPAVWSIVFFFTVMLIITLIPCIFSYRMYKKHQLQQNIPE